MLRAVEEVARFFFASRKTDVELKLRKCYLVVEQMHGLGLHQQQEHLLRESRMMGLV